jgi:hypothetical protein
MTSKLALHLLKFSLLLSLLLLLLYFWRTEEIHRNFSHCSWFLGQELDPTPTEYEAEVLPSWMWCSVCCCNSLIHGAAPFLRSRQLCSYSRTSQHFMEPEGSWSLSWARSNQSIPVHTIPSIFFSLGCLSKEFVQIQGFLWSFLTSLIFMVRSC